MDEESDEDYNVSEVQFASFAISFMRAACFSYRRFTNYGVTEKPLLID